MPLGLMPIPPMLPPPPPPPEAAAAAFFFGFSTITACAKSGQVSWLGPLRWLLTQMFSLSRHHGVYICASSSRRVYHGLTIVLRKSRDPTPPGQASPGLLAAPGWKLCSGFRWSKAALASLQALPVASPSQPGQRT